MLWGQGPHVTWFCTALVFDIVFQDQRNRDKGNFHFRQISLRLALYFTVITCSHVGRILVKRIKLFTCVAGTGTREKRASSSAIANH
jgi:hypothetical protein